MAIIPKTNVSQVDNVTPGKPGSAGKVAVVAEFSKTLTTPVSVRSYSEAVKAVTTAPVTSTSPVGDKILNALFKGGATEVILKDIAPASSGNPTGVEIVTGATSLEENYDILFIPYDLSDANLTAIKSYTDDRFKNSHPVGLTAPLTRESDSDYATTAEIFQDGGLFGLVTQQYTVDDTVLSLAESAAYLTGRIAERRVDVSFTMKTLEGVEGVTPEFTFAEEDTGYNLVDYGYPIVKCLNRQNKHFVIVNSRLPHTVTATDGSIVHLDLYMERTINFIINSFQLENYLGDKNIPLTLEAIEQRLARVKHDCVDTLQLVEDISYSLEKGDKDTVQVNIEEIVFAGVITLINVNVTYDVQ